MILYMYIALGQEQKTPWGQTFDVNRKPLPLRPFGASFEQISLNSNFIHIFKRKALSLCPFVASFKRISLKSDLYNFFYVFIHVYSPGAGADNRLGSDFYININLLSLW